MKQAFMTSVALLSMVIALGGCHATQKHAISESSSTVTKKTSTKISNQESSKASQESSKTSKMASSSVASQPMTSKKSESRLDTLNAALIKVIGNNKKPMADGLDSDSDNLNMRYTTNKYGYTIYYSVGNTPKNFNDGTVASEKPYATFSKTAYSSMDKADKAVPYIDPKGLPAVDLGNERKAYSDLSAGSSGLVWKAGRWSVMVTSVTGGGIGENGVPATKKVMALFDKYTLPVPNKVGGVLFRATPVDLSQTIIWQEGATVYSLSAHSTETAIKMASSVK